MILGGKPEWRSTEGSLSPTFTESTKLPTRAIVVRADRRMFMACQEQDAVRYLFLVRYL